MMNLGRHTTTAILLSLWWTAHQTCLRDLHLAALFRFPAGSRLAARGARIWEKGLLKGWLTACEKLNVLCLFSTGHNGIRYRDRTLLIFCWRFTHETLVTVVDLWKRIGVMLCKNLHKLILPEDLQLLRKTYRSSGRLITATEEL